MNNQTEEIGLGLMYRGGLAVMIGGAAFIMGCVLGLIFESRLVAFVMGIAATVGIAAFLSGIVVWGSGWMLRED